MDTVSPSAFRWRADLARKLAKRRRVVGVDPRGRSHCGARKSERNAIARRDGAEPRPLPLIRLSVVRDF